MCCRSEHPFSVNLWLSSMAHLGCEDSNKCEPSFSVLKTSCNTITKGTMLLRLGDLQQYPWGTNNPDQVLIGRKLEILRPHPWLYSTIRDSESSIQERVKQTPVQQGKHLHFPAVCPFSIIILVVTCTFAVSRGDRNLYPRPPYQTTVHGHLEKPAVPKVEGSALK